MNYASKQNKRNNRGFTLAEMLIGVAILVVLMSIAIPGAVAFQRKLHMAELDDYARQIFMAAQSEMTNMKASGRLDVFNKTIDGTHELKQRPKDYPGDESDRSWEDLFWVSSDEATTQKYLMKANTSLTEATAKGGHFLLLLNPLSGDVYGAFYSEEEITIDTVMALNDWTRATRSEATPKIGYYGSTENGTTGGQIEYGTVGLPKTFAPKLEVVNGEELYVKISCSGMRALRWTQSKLELKLTVTDAHNNSMQQTYTGGTDFMIMNDSITVTKILDSLETKNSFGKVCSSLTPGDDLTIKVELEYSDDKNNKLITGSAEKTVNSLFDSVEKGTDGTITEINVSKVRHLNNLRSSIYNDVNSVNWKSGAKIVQTGSISFDWVDWESNDYVSQWTKNPMTKFPAIDCGNLLNGGGYNGGGNVLKGFLFTGTNSGLFDSLSGATLTKMRFADCSSSGKNAGILAGSLTNCTVTDCGAYLNTKDKNNARYENMDIRRKTYSVKGTSSAGGLAAKIYGGSLKYCFAAVDISGGSNLGGLAGITNGATIESSYASGNLSDNLSGKSENMGGLIGSMTDGSVNNCYATGKVYCTGRVAGGLIGVGHRTSGSVSGNVSNSVSYGIVAKNEEDTVANSSGGFIGQNNGISFFGCKFLQQANYNSSSSYTTASGVDGRGYNSLRVSGGVDNKSNSDPYSSALRGQAFPFVLNANGTGGKMTHYGDWPEPYKLENALVYYERYGDGTYGYYAKTSLLDSDGKATGNWVLDTLKNEVCVEDGYALLTVYKLSSFTYDLNTGDIKGSNKENIKVEIADDPNSAPAYKAPLLLENVSLQFKDYSVEGNGVGYAETTISNAKMYRLPFDLQVTTRTAATKFWETLTITGYSASTKAKVIDKAVFYYCPDFAKNAVNAVDVSAEGPSEPTEKTPIYVRSARQLNALSRSTYYWNQNVKSHNGEVSKLYFLQETDIDFGTYARYKVNDETTKTSYCGQTFDLMDTSKTNPYRNQPIGTPNKDNNPSLPSNFQNIYDGQGHKIIDYCQLNTEYQFAGLFGEVEYATLKNIVMVASVPDDGKGHCSAYIKSSFNNSSYKSGVGALAGLLYERTIGTGFDPNKAPAQIVNCSVSGYRVEYIGGDNMSYAAGGLVGFNFGSVSNSSAVCNVYGSDKSGTDGRIGGLVGSMNGKSTVSNSYSGGTIYASKSAQVGGISGGIYNIFGYNHDQWARYRPVKVSNCYTYCTLNNSNLAGAYSVYPIAVASDEYTLTVEKCYYLTDTMTYVNTQYMNGVSGKSYDELHNLIFTDDSNNPISGTVDGYPFPAFVRKIVNGNYGDFVHYGDWPLKTP